MCKCQHCHEIGDDTDPVITFKDGIEIGGETYSYLHQECKEALLDVHSGSGPDPMHPNETPDEFWSHEDKG